MYKHSQSLSEVIKSEFGIFNMSLSKVTLMLQMPPQIILIKINVRREKPPLGDHRQS